MSGAPRHDPSFLTGRINHGTSESSRIYARGHGRQVPTREEALSATPLFMDLQHTPRTDSGQHMPANENSNISPSFDPLSPAISSSSRNTLGNLLNPIVAMPSTGHWPPSDASSFSDRDSGLPFRGPHIEPSDPLQFPSTWTPSALSKDFEPFNMSDTGGIEFDQLLDLSLVTYFGDDPSFTPAPTLKEAGPPLYSPNPFLRVQRAIGVSSLEHDNHAASGDHTWKDLDDAQWSNRLEKLKEFAHIVPKIQSSFVNLIQDRHLKGQCQFFLRSAVLNRYVSAYMSSVNPHLRFFHVPTLDLNEMEFQLLFALASIGAEYVFEREHAMKLHALASDLLSLHFDNANSWHKLSHIQATLLCLLFAAWNGGPLPYVDYLIHNQQFGLHLLLERVKHLS
jgi:hypothetical protein